MAKITSVDMSIQRETFNIGSICNVRYAYILECDALEVDGKMGYIVWAELWGKELLGEKLIGNAIFDSHSTQADKIVRNHREFTVPCGVLNEKIGPDVLFVRVKAESTLGVEIQADSLTIKDSF